MLKYTLGLIRRGTQLLLLNRENPAWMGCWNGVGGKLEPNESPRSSMLREIAEETQIVPEELHFKGLITWSTADGQGFGGLYLYLATLPEPYVYRTPVKTSEGILDWKEIDWIRNPDNIGVAANIPYCLDKLLYDRSCYNYHSFFEGHRIIRQTSVAVDRRIEEDEPLLRQYLSGAMSRAGHAAAR